MPNWKKVITSGSNASLSSLFVTNVTASIVSASQFTGSLFGTASWATNTVTASTSTITATNTATGNHFLVFVSESAILDGTSVVRDLRIDTSTLTWNPNTNTLAATNFSGNASSATNVGITNTTATAGTYYITFVGTTGPTDNIEVDSTGLTYNPSTNIITATASLAQTASYVTGSIFTSANPVLSASYAITASHALNAGPGSIPGGSDTQIQYNSSNTFAGSPNFTFSGSNTVRITGSLITSGSSTTVGSAVVSGSFTVITGSAIELQVTNTGVKIGNVVTDTHTVTGSFNISGSATINGNVLTTGSLFVSSSNNTQLQVGSDLLFVSRSGNVGVGTTTPVGRLQVDLNNTDYLNVSGSGSHVVLNNPNAAGQNAVTSIINGNRAAKWRTDYVGGNAFVSYGGSGYFTWFTNGDYTEGDQKMTLWNNGNVRISNNAGLSNTGDKLFVGNGTIGHNGHVIYDTARESISAGGNKITLVSFDPGSYYACFIDYHVYYSAKSSRAGNVKVSVPHNYTSLEDQYNIPFVENTTEWRTDASYPTITTEDIYFRVNYNGTNIYVEVYNDNATDTAFIRASYKLIVA